MTAPRQYEVRARSTDTFGRVLCSAREQHFVIDGPVQNGCPGEALTPPEAFLAGVASCGVELLHVLARDEHVPLREVEAAITGTIDRGSQPRPDITLFTTVRLALTLRGVTDAQAERLVAGFKRR